MFRLKRNRAFIPQPSIDYFSTLYGEDFNSTYYGNDFKDKAKINYADLQDKIRARLIKF